VKQNSVITVATVLLDNAVDEDLAHEMMYSIVIPQQHL